MNPVEVRTNAHETKGNDMNLAGASPPLSKLILHPHTGSIRGGGGNCSIDMPSVLERLASFPTPLPVSLQLSLLRDAFAMLSLEVLCPWSFPDFHGASQSSAEFPSLLQSSPVFSRVPQSLLELLLVHRSCCYFLKAPFPRSSSEILREASPVFRELSCCLL